MRITWIIMVFLIAGLLILTSCGGSESVQPTPTSFSNKIVQIDAKTVSYPVLTPVFTPKTIYALAATSDIVYTTPKNESYHRAGCRYLWKSRSPIERSEAVDKGYQPCSFCRP